MVIRGAPGDRRGRGVRDRARRAEQHRPKGTRQLAVDFQKTCDLMAATRPTAVNLFWAIDRMKRVFAKGHRAASLRAS
jgi:methylthioribose-1-phosphate isomerase